MVISTYESPAYLEMVLAGYARQDRRDFEVLIADDGSGEETRALIDRVRAQGFPVPLLHVWQPDHGFRKARAQCLAVLHARAPWVIFTDGDTVPMRDMVSQHLRAAAPDRFVVGGHARLTQEVSATLDVPRIDRGEHEGLVRFDQRVWMWRVQAKNVCYILTGRMRSPKVYGLNMSVGRAALVAVNGPDAAFVDSAREDSDLRNRLRVAGFRGRSIWHRCIPVHLWHPQTARRRGWAEGNRYLNRPELPVRAPVGLAEVAAAHGLPAPDPARVPEWPAAAMVRVEGG